VSTGNADRTRSVAFACVLILLACAGPMTAANVPQVEHTGKIIWEAQWFEQA